MSKNIIAALLLIVISGCDSKIFSIREVKWAAVDNSKLRQVIAERLKAENPYPQEINQNSEEIQHERSKLGQQISEITSAGNFRCRELVSQENKTTKNENLQNRGYLIVTPSDPMQIYKAQQNPQYQNCIRELKNDQLVTNLQEKISQIDAIFSARQKHDRLVQEKVTAKIAVIVSNYAEKNNFDLILLNSSNNIIYNKSKITLDITEAVLNSTIVTK